MTVGDSDRASDDTLRWLLAGDPAIAWQVMRDLLDERADRVAAERARVATEGWGAQLLALQSAAGNWGGPNENAGWMPTIYTLTVLMDLGLDPGSGAARSMIGRAKRLVFHESLGGRPLLDGETEPCINGRILAFGAYFDGQKDRLAEQLLNEQLEDGGWNCEAPPSRVSSFHSTICVLEGLLAYERAGGRNAGVAAARERGERYLLDRRLQRSLRSGEVIDETWQCFAFPPFWHYDVLRGLDYLRRAAVPPDARVDEAVEAVRARQRDDGRWPLDVRHPERVAIEFETDLGGPSRWNTLRALRVLRWYVAARRSAMPA